MSLPAFSQGSSGCPIPQAGPGTFTLFWITDTQYLSEYNLALFNQTTQWIADNYAACNGKMVIHTGDIVNDWDAPSEWANANKAMSILLDAGIPYTWDAGNHDFCGPPSDSGVAQPCPSSGPSYFGDEYDAFNATVVASKEARNWVGSSDDGKDTAVNFTANSSTFLIINIEYNGLAELPWVDGLLSQYPTARVIIATHAYMNDTGGIPGWDRAIIHDFTGNLTAMMNADPNVFLTMNGHYDECGTLVTDPCFHHQTGSGSRWDVMFNRQELDPVKKSYIGAASVTTITVSLANDEAHVNTFDLLTGTPTIVPGYSYSLELGFSPLVCSPTLTLTASTQAVCPAPKHRLTHALPKGDTAV